ncbi:MAG: methyltransferase domain-containing protein [Agriterribacter sp.]
MAVLRRKFQGVLNILSFNRHFYVMGMGALAILTSCYFIFDWPPLVFGIIISAFAYGLLMPLIVSAYVYDFSGYYEFHWLQKIIDNKDAIREIVNINAGFDETSFIIESKFPDAGIKVFDFYNAKQHTEPAIKRARKVSTIYPGTQQIATHVIPLQRHSTDLIFLLSAAHEIRSHKEKIIFLKECHRICKLGGKVVMVEHLRDFPNFLAFTVGFTHFFSRAAWKSAFTKAGFSSFREIKFTPFMSVFLCNP